MLFYIGLHVLPLAKHFDRCFISVNILKKRRSNFIVNNWILDSGAFSELSKHGEYKYSVEEYAKDIERWRHCGNLEIAVGQDYMCEPFMLEKTGLSVKEHQRLTIERYDKLINLTNFPIMPVLQGYEPQEYIEHIDMYGGRLEPNMRVGVGTLCKRNINVADIISVLDPIKAKCPHLKLHGLGLKTTATSNAYIASLIDSSDSMAWSFHARINGRDANSLDEAVLFKDKVEHKLGRKPAQLLLKVT